MIIETFIEKFIENFTNNWFYIYWFLVIVFLLIGLFKIGKDFFYYDIISVRLAFYICIILTFLNFLGGYIVCNKGYVSNPIINAGGFLFLLLFPTYSMGTLVKSNHEYFPKFLLGACLFAFFFFGWIPMARQSTRIFKDLYLGGIGMLFKPEDVKDKIYKEAAKPCAVPEGVLTLSDGKSWNIGYNLVYKSVYDGSYLNFIDILGNAQSISYKTRNYACSDTVLVFNNIKDTVSNRFIVCDKSVNTTENWLKISDYGYIFHYDIYSKEEVESQCPRIREYVEKYKEWNVLR